MSTSCDILATTLRERLAEQLLTCEVRCGEVTVEVAPPQLREVCFALRDEAAFGFEQLHGIQPRCRRGVVRTPAVR
jgi:hypothetical protein